MKLIDDLILKYCKKHKIYIPPDPAEQPKITRIGHNVRDVHAAVIVPEGAIDKGEIERTLTAELGKEVYKYADIITEDDIFMGGMRCIATVIVIEGGAFRELKL